MPAGKVLDWQQTWPPISLACKNGQMDQLKECLAKNRALLQELEALDDAALRERAIADLTAQAEAAAEAAAEEGEEGGQGAGPPVVDLSALDAAQASDAPRQQTLLMLCKAHKNDPNTVNTRGSTCVMICAQYGTPTHVEMLKLLLQTLIDAGRSDEIDTRRESDQQTAYHMSCFWNKQESALALVEAGCDTAAPEKYGRCGRQMAEIRELGDLIAALDGMGVAETAAGAVAADRPSDTGGVIGSDAARAAEGLPPEETPEERRARVKEEQRLKAEQAKIAEVAEKMPVAAAIVSETSLLCHDLLNEPSNGLFFIHKHVRRTAVPIHETSTELEKMNQEAKTRCHDVDDITPFVDGVGNMPHIRNVKLLIQKALDTPLGDGSRLGDNTRRRR